MLVMARKSERQEFAAMVDVLNVLGRWSRCKITGPPAVYLAALTHYMQALVDAVVANGGNAGAGRTEAACIAAAALRFMIDTCPANVLMTRDRAESARRTAKRIYVAGPITKGDQAVNVTTAIFAGDRLLRAGFAPFIPHLSHFWHMLAPHTHGEWLDYDEQWLSQCDALLRLPGESVGADREVAFAERHGIPVYYSEEELIANES